MFAVFNEVLQPQSLFNRYFRYPEKTKVTDIDNTKKKDRRNKGTARQYALALALVCPALQYALIPNTLPIY